MTTETTQKLRVWWAPQIGSAPTFYTVVPNLVTAKLLLDTLAQYDLFQLRNNIKPDFANGGGLEVYEDGEWQDWESPEGDDIDNYEVEELAAFDNQ